MSLEYCQRSFVEMINPFRLVCWFTTSHNLGYIAPSRRGLLACRVCKRKEFLLGEEVVWRGCAPVHKLVVCEHDEARNVYYASGPVISDLNGVNASIGRSGLRPLGATSIRREEIHSDFLARLHKYTRASGKEIWGSDIV